VNSESELKRRHDTIKIATTIFRRIMSGLLYLSFTSLVATLELEGQQLRGQVVKGDSPLTAGYVMLHSVSSMRSGQVDSVSLSSEGYFEFQLQGFNGVGGSDEVYFASFEHQGVLYFGGAITDISQLDNNYLIPVFSAKIVPKEGITLPLKVRNILLEEVTGSWRVRDVIALENLGNETLIPSEGGAVWTYPLPVGFRNPEVVRGELPPEDVVFTDEGVLVRAPLPPGERMLVIVYELTGLDTTFPAPGPTEAVELFVKEPGPSIQVSNLSPLDVVSLEPGSSYRRYSASGLNDVDISLSEVFEGEPYPLGRISLAIGILLGSVILVSGINKSHKFTSRRVALANERKSILLKIALLDQRLENAIADKDIAELRAKREDLLGLLIEQG
tara:strand:- start:1110 stop:2273 length:1164 start_codon:yes stop_codon:yes gene_type:complete